MMTEFIVEEYYEKYQKKTYLDVFFDFLKKKLSTGFSTKKRLT